MGIASAYGYANLGKIGYGVATGGTGSLATPPAGYSGLYFHSSLTLTVTTAGLFDVLAFGGGGSGGYGNNFNRCGAGGGATGGAAGGGGGGARCDGGTLSGMPSMDKMLAPSAAGLMAYFDTYA